MHPSIRKLGQLWTRYLVGPLLTIRSEDSKGKGVSQEKFQNATSDLKWAANKVENSTGDTISTL
jgi:hypothetical protein